MQDRPTIDELLNAVEMFLRETAVAELEGQPKFHARVAANAVAIVRRELTLDAAGEEAETGRLSALIGQPSDRDELNDDLAGRIREGGDLDTGKVLEHLRQTAEEKLAVANPKYKPEA